MHEAIEMQPRIVGRYIHIATTCALYGARNCAVGSCAAEVKENEQLRERGRATSQVLRHETQRCERI